MVDASEAQGVRYLFDSNNFRENELKSITGMAQPAQAASVTRSEVFV